MNKERYTRKDSGTFDLSKMPSIEDLSTWPQTIETRDKESEKAKVDAEVAKIREEIAAKEAEIKKIQERARNPRVRKVQLSHGYHWVKESDPTAIEDEAVSKEKVLSFLADIAIKEGQTLTIDYKGELPDSESSRYREEFRSTLIRHAGMYILGITTLDRGRASHYYSPTLPKPTEYHTVSIVGEALDTPMTINHVDLRGSDNLTAQRASMDRWAEITDHFGSESEKYISDQVLGIVLPLLESIELKDRVYSNGNVDKSKGIAKRVIPLEFGLEVVLEAQYWRDFDSKNRDTYNLSSVIIALDRDGVQIEGYCIDIDTLDTLQTRDDTWEKLYARKARKLAETAVVALEKSSWNR